jgi:hypothetical protein
LKLQRCDSHAAKVLPALFLLTFREGPNTMPLNVNGVLKDKDEVALKAGSMRLPLKLTSALPCSPVVIPIGNVSPSIETTPVKSLPDHDAVIGNRSPGKQPVPTHCCAGV